MSLPDLSQTRCRNHGEREAVARCGECRNFFCRECVVEHQGRMVCTDCLIEVANTAPDRKRSGFRRVAQSAGLLVSFGFTWLLFCMLGRLIVFLREVWGTL